MAVDHPVPCPACRRSVSLRLAWELTPKNRYGFLSYSTGIVCPSCGARLRIVERHAKAVAVAIGLSGLAICAVAAPWSATVAGTVAMGIGAIGIGLGLYPSGYAQRFLSAELRTGTSSVDFPVERLKQELAIATGGRDEASEAMLQAAKEYWVCTHCGEPNPNVSGYCFSCGKFNAAAI